MKNRIQWLDALRGVASVWVVFFHLNEGAPNHNNVYLTLVSLGWVGVPIFFFISGYCIRMIIKKPISSLEFIVKRFFRIYPAYYFSLLVIIFVILIRILTRGVNDITILPIDFYSIFATLSILTEPALDVPKMNWVYWSLTYEVTFYAIISICLLFSKNWREFLLLGLVIISIFVRAKDFTPLFFLQHFGAFMMGYYAFILFSEEKLAGKLLGLTGVLSCMSSIFLNAGYPYESKGFYYLVATFSAFILSLVFKYFNISFPKIATNIGLSSYSLYLIHVPVGVLILGRQKGFAIPETPALHFLVDLTIVGILTFVSFLIFKYIEYPFHNLGGKLAILLNAKAENTIFTKRR